MSSAKAVRRGPATKRKSPSRKSSRPAPRPSLARYVASIAPVSEAGVRRAGNYALLALFAGALTTAGLMLRLPQALGWQIGEGIGALGFTVERVQIVGLEREEGLPDYVDTMPVYAAALGQPSMAMPNIDLSDIRDEVEALGWVRSARVSRRLPDMLVVAIVERVPVAIWQNEGRLYLIDAEGAVLAPVALDAMPDLPLIVGPGANFQAAAFEELISAAPALRPMLDGASWIGGRRWDLRFQTGETLALPEGDQPAADALIRFARMDGVTGLLGEGFKRFDMRIPGRFVVRVERGREPRAASGEEPENI